MLLATGKSMDGDSIGVEAWPEGGEGGPGNGSGSEPYPSIAGQQVYRSVRLC